MGVMAPKCKNFCMDEWVSWDSKAQEPYSSGEEGISEEGILRHEGPGTTALIWDSVPVEGHPETQELGNLSAERKPL